MTTETDDWRATGRRWVAEFFEIPLQELGLLPDAAYQRMLATVLDDLERRQVNERLRCAGRTGYVHPSDAAKSQCPTCRFAESD